MLPVDIKHCTKLSKNCCQSFNFLRVEETNKSVLLDAHTMLQLFNSYYLNFNIAVNSNYEELTWQ